MVWSAPMGSVNVLSGEHEHKRVTRSIDISKQCPLYFAGKLESDDEELLTSVEKKRRLNADQVNYLEANFNMDCKLEPERKAILANHLGIRPRQVAIWFQNRRARWKTQQLEQDYENLKTNYESETKEKNRLLNEYDLAKEANKRLRVEVACLTSSLQGFERSDTMEAEEEQPSSGKSEVFSTSKSGNDPNEVQDSGQSCRTLPETVMVVRPSLHIEQPRSASLGECKPEESNVPSSDCNVVGLPTWTQHVIAKGYSPDSAYNALYEWEKHFAGPAW